MVSLRTFSLAFALVVAGCSSEGATGTSNRGGGDGTTRNDRRSDDDSTDRDSTDPDDSTDPPSNPSNPSNPSKPSKKANGAQCQESADCESDFCVFRNGGSSVGMCTTTCDSDLDCEFQWKCVNTNGLQKVCIPN